jgi:CubicO group peptidase (beta-lactamase class C family)
VEKEDVDLIDNLAERAMRSGRRVGLVVGYVAGGEEWVRGYGRCGTGARDRPDGGTIFEIGSVTKVFTGLLLADLAERGIVGLDDPLARYLPASAAVPTSGGREITLADLASHTSWLRRDPKGMLGRWLSDRHNPYAALSAEDVYEGLARTRLRRRPGERARYSNLGAGLLGQALARAAGRPYEQLVRERIGLPLEMYDTFVTPSEEQAVRLAVGHTRRGRPVGRFELPALAGAGALRSTAPDMLRFLAANLDPASTPLAAQLERIQRPRHQMGRGMDVGLGWLIVRPRGPARAMLWHNGGTNGFRSFVGAIRDAGVAVVVLGNTRPVGRPARPADRQGTGDRRRIGTGWPVTPAPGRVARARLGDGRADPGLTRARGAAGAGRCRPPSTAPAAPPPPSRSRSRRRSRGRSRRGR